MCAVAGLSELCGYKVDKCGRLCRCCCCSLRTGIYAKSYSSVVFVVE